MADIAADILAKIAKYAVDPIVEQLNYVVCFKANVENLKDEAVKLDYVKSEVEIQVNAGVRNAEIINPATERWLLDVVKDVAAAQTIIQHKANFNKGCLNQCCLNLKPRYVLSRNAKKKTKDIIKLRQDGNFDRVSFPPQSIQIVTSTSTMNFGTRECILDEIIRNLKDENISMIGICGMGGVGKTTMAEMVCKRVKEEKLFDDCAMSVISRERDNAKTQIDIAEMLGLKLHEQNPRVREGKLHKRLENSRVLVILDDVWAEFDLKELGITFRGLQKGCKVLFTAREEGLWRELKTKIEYPLDVLSEEEAWKLFKTKVNDSLEDESELQSVAKEIVKECGGLPLALVTIGGALRVKSKYLWKDTLRQLKTNYSTKIRGVSAKVYQSLELSYNFLDEDDAKSLFLLCSMFKEDSDIPSEDLIRMVLGLRLFKRINDLEQTRDRVLSLLEQLKHRYLLLPGKKITNSIKYVRMHDVVRDVAKYIATVENGALVVENHDGVTMLQEHNTIKDSLWISIIPKDIKDLPTELRFPRVKLLRCSNNVLKTTLSFLDGMREIRVLDVHGTGSPPFPSLLRLPSSLLTLFFRNCELNNLSSIGNLPHLESLSFVGSHMKELPVKIGQLANLVSLDLTKCSDLRTIQPGIISGLCQLQELYMGNISIDWEGGENKQGRNASLREFESLSNLHTLHIKIKDPSALPGCPLFRNLKKYQIQIGNGYVDNSGSYDKGCSIHLSMPIPLEGNIKFLLKNSEELRFTGEFTKDLVHGLVQDGSRTLKCLDVGHIDTIEYFANAEASLLLSSVESLSLRNLGNLQQLSRIPLMVWSCENLKDLEVGFCGKLKNLFQLSVAIEFVHLKKLVIQYCESMEEIIWKEQEENETNKLAFPKLEKLEIVGPLSLVSFCRGINEVEFPQLESMFLWELPKVECLFSGFSNQSFFPHKVSFPSMKIISLLDMVNMKEIWCGQLQSGSFCNLTELVVIRCHKLRAVFTPCVAKNLVHLQYLHIENCSLLEVVFAKEKEEYGVEDTIILPKLKTIFLCELPALENFCLMAHDLECPMLSDLRVIECPQLKTFSPGFVRTPKLKNVRLTNWHSEKQLILWEDNLNKTIAYLHKLNLKRLEVSDIDTLENLANATASLLFTTVEILSLKNLYKLQQLSHSPLMVGSFKNLTDLRVSQCNKLKNLFQLSVATEFMHLRKLSIKDCKSMVEVIWKEHEEDEINKLAFSKLERLEFQDLPSLVSFCRGIDEVQFPQLEKLILLKLPQVECLFSGLSNQSFFPRKVTFPSLGLISLIGCHKLCAVFTPCVARNLVHLLNLYIENCSLLKVVVSKEEGEDVVEDKTLLPKLRTITLYELLSLESFWHVARDLEYPMLSNLRVIECAQLKTFSPGFVCTPKLKVVRLTNQDAEKQVTIWEDNLNSTIAHLHKQNQQRQQEGEDGH